MSGDLRDRLRTLAALAVMQMPANAEWRQIVENAAVELERLERLEASVRVLIASCGEPRRHEWVPGQVGDAGYALAAAAYKKTMQLLSTPAPTEDHR